MSTHPPRPLHLITNSITSTPTTDIFPLSSPISRFQHTERLSMMASASFSNSSPTMGGFDNPMRTKTTRRKSSIGYFPPDSIGSPYRDSLTRRNSLGTPNSTSSASQGHVKSRPRPLSTSPKLEVDTSSGSPARVRQPITLMERNADFLRLIAQKESKCLELRSQLEMHEVELAELKRKWQKIVNKGLECGHRSVASSADASTIVFDGIKEGVQGVSRLLSARFSYNPPPSSYPTESTQSERCLPPLLNKYHCAQESDSSISTYMTSRLGTTPGRSSQSSMSSFGEDRSGTLEGNLCLEGERMDDSHGNGKSQVQVLMVRDTGATPTMSPNPEFHQQKRRRDQDSCVSASLSTLRLNDANIEYVNPNITGDFKGQLRICDIQATAVQEPGRISQEAQLDLEQLDFSMFAPSVLLSRQNSNVMCTETSPQPGPSPSLSYVEPGGSALISSIPGTVSSPPVFSWMDNVGKKLKELHKSSTFSKSRKRASLFLSDMTNSAVNMLVASSTITQEPSCSMTIDTAGKASDPQVATAPPNAKISGSLLDDEDKNETAKLGPATVLQPATPVPALSKKIGVQAKKEIDEDEWNW